MGPEELRKQAEAPTDDPAIAGLWWAAQGNWDRAHACAQEGEGGKAADWVHAYLHRVEGDLSNAQYWYARAGKPVSEASLEDEWDEIARALLGPDGRRV